MQLSVFSCEQQRMMAYAIFKDDEKLSRTFPTKEETLAKAREAGPVDTVKGKPVLEDNLTIKRWAHPIPNAMVTRISSGRLTSADVLIGRLITPQDEPQPLSLIPKLQYRSKKRRPPRPGRNLGGGVQLADGTSASAVSRKPATSLLVPELRLVGCTHLAAAMTA